MRILKNGFSLPEIIVVLAIMLIITSVSTRIFQNANKKQSLEKAVSNIVSVINSVRSLAVSSKEFCSYGINISTTSNSISSFVVLDPNCNSNNFEPTFLSLNNFGTIISSSTIGNGEVTFQRITGNIANTYFLSLQLRDNSDSSTTITIYPTGLLEIK